MIVYGIDPGQNCGVCIYDTDRTFSAMVASLVKAPSGDDVEIEEKVHAISRALCILMRKTRPDLVAIEMQMRGIPAKGGNAATLVSANQIVGGVVCLCAIKDIPFVTIPVGTWRSKFYPDGFKPPVKIIKHRDGTETRKPDWKSAARNKCAELRIAVTNHDMAEACGIAFAATFEQTFKKLRHDLQEAA